MTKTIDQKTTFSLDILLLLMMFSLDMWLLYGRLLFVGRFAVVLDPRLVVGLTDVALTVVSNRDNFTVSV